MLTGNTSGSIEVGVPEGVSVGIGDPRHFSLSSSHVGGGHVDARSKESLLGELDGEATGDALQLVVAVVLGVDLDAGLAATEGYVNAGALVRHEGGQGLHLVGAHVHGVTNTSLAGGPENISDL